MQTIIECVPNFSEGRDARKVDAIIQAMLAGPDVFLLDQEMDADHNRCVITLVGSRESIGEAALRGMGRAAELIDLTKHQGAHPRMGATDVVPFVPISGVTLEDCVHIAERVAEEAWRRFKIPTYLYEAAARRPERRNLENIRRGQFEGLREEIGTNPERCPDFGEAALHPTAGATVVGARKFLIAYNINLDTAAVGLAKTIAKRIRTSTGGLPCVKAMGVELKARNLAQVSMNLTDFETTSIGVVFDAVAREAAAQGVSVVGSEIVGLIPRRALEDAAVHYLKVENYRPESIVENRLEQVLAQQASSRKLRALVEGFVAAVAAPGPTPGGGSVAALAGALAAALGEMVCGVTLKRKSFEAHHPALEECRTHLARLREILMENIDRDSESFEAFMVAMKLPKATESEQAARASALEKASRHAAEVPLETAELVREVEATLAPLPAMTIPQATSDLSVALALAEAARGGAIENVHVNLASIQDRAWVEGIEARLRRLAESGM
ncbi:MAG: glutamate formimidoyltransferase [Acidobacteriia bacterium]|nr:glutamate formimidoyltransferase [Terriglobia bacterium]